MSSSPDRLDAVYDALVGDEDGRVCKDIPESACTQLPGNFFRQLGAMALTKLGDALASPKTTLAWTLGALGAPAWMVGLLVPVRESGSMLPQLFIAARVRALPRRKPVWLLGALLQAAAVAGMAAGRGLASGMMASLASVFALFALAVAVFWDMIAAAALGIAALLIQRTAQRVDAMLRLGSVLGSPWNLPLLLILATVLAIGWREGGDEPLARAGAVMTVALLAFLPHIRGPKGNGAGWWCIGPASALLLLMLADIAGLTPAGLAIVALLATAGLAVQHGLPRNGRDRRGSDV